MNAEDLAQIAPTSQASLADALALVFRDMNADERTHRTEAWREADAGGRAGDGVLEARRGGRLCGAVAWQVQQGRTAVAWPSRVSAGEPQTTARRLMEAAVERLAAAGVRMVQMLFEHVSEVDDRLLRLFDFVPLAKLLYLVSEEIDFPQALPAGPLEFEPSSEAGHARLAAVVEATYQGTLDCPALDGVRDTDDVFAGYRATGVFRPELWMIVQHQGRDVGCLLLADHPGPQSCELVYMGLIPTARGKGWGLQIARHAQWTARGLGRPQLVAAVDSHNRPAKAVYAALGFRQFDRRMVYMRVV